MIYHINRYSMEKHSCLILIWILEWRDIGGGKHMADITRPHQDGETLDAHSLEAHSLEALPRLCQYSSPLEASFVLQDCMSSLSVYQWKGLQN